MSGPLNLDSQVAWTRIATLPSVVPGPVAPGYGGNLNANVAGNPTIATCSWVVDDNSIVVLLQSSQADPSVADVYPYVVDASGALTSYAAPGIVHSGNLRRVHSYGNGNLVITNVGPEGTVVWNASFYNAKLNNPVPIIIPSNTLTLLGPCGEPGPPKFFYDTVRQLVAYGFYGAQGQFGGSLSARVFGVNPINGSLSLIVSGPVGVWNSQSGQDDFDHTGGLVGGRAGTMTNGIVGNVSATASTTGTVLVDIHAGVNNPCPGPPFTGTVVVPRGINIVYPWFQDIGADLCLLDTNIPGIMMTGGNNGQFVQFFAPGLTAVLTPASAPPLNFGGGYDLYQVVATRKHLFAVWGGNPNAFGALTNPVFVSALPAGLNPQPVATAQNHHYAANYARPISLTGRFKA